MVRMGKKLTLNYYGLTKEKLVKLYWEEQLTIKQISERIGAPLGTVRSWFRRLKIPTRGKTPVKCLRSNVNILNEAQRGYIAGIIDGEGSIQLTKHKRRGTLVHLDPRVQISTLPIC